jgi:hypothetical protein
MMIFVYMDDGAEEVARMKSDNAVDTLAAIKACDRIEIESQTYKLESISFEANKGIVYVFMDRE